MARRDFRALHGSGDPVAQAARCTVEQLESRVLLATTIGQPSWVEQGPGPAIGSAAIEVPPLRDLAGAVEALAAPPNTSHILFAAAVNGGVWRTLNATDARPTWRPMANGLGGLSMGALTLAKFDAAGNKITSTTSMGTLTIEEYANKLTLYAGNAKLSSNSDLGTWRNGLYKSTDGGRSWKQMDKKLRRFDIRSIVPHESEKDTVLVAGMHPKNKKLGGVWRSVKGGDDFVRVLDVPVSHLVTDAGNPEVFYAGAPGKGVYVSTEGGRAGTWRLVNSGLNSILNDGVDDDYDGLGTAGKPDPYESVARSTRIELAVHHSDNGNAVYVLMVGFNDKIMSVHRSTTANLTGANPQWNQVKGSLPNGHVLPDLSRGSQGETHLAILADRSDPDVVFVAGDTTANVTGNIWRADTSEPNPLLVWKPMMGPPIDPDDAGPLPAHGGAADKDGPGGLDSTSPHPDSRDMVWNSNGEIIQADDGGIYRLTLVNTDDRFWESVNGNLRATEFISIAYDPLNRQLLGGLQDNGSVLQPRNANLASHWLPYTNGGDGSITQVAVEHHDNVRHYTSTQEWGKFSRRTYDSVGNLIGDVVYPNLTIVGGAGRTLTGTGVQKFRNDPKSSRLMFDGSIPFYPLFQVNAAEPTRLLFGTSYIYESFNRGDTLVPIGGLNTSRVSDGVDDDGDKGKDANNNPNPDPVDADEVFSKENFGKVSAMAYGGWKNGVAAPDVAYVASGRKLSFREKIGVNNTIKDDFKPTEYAKVKGTGRIRDIALDPADYTTGYVIDDKDQVWRFVNSGLSAANWTNVNGKGKGSITHAASQFQSIEVIRDTEAPEGVIVLVGGEGGVRATFNPSAGEQARWVRVGQRLPGVIVSDVRYDPSDVLYIGTLGRGAWKIESFLTKFDPPAPPAGSSGGDGPPAITTAGGTTTLTITGDELADKNDVIRLVRDQGDSDLLHVFVNNTGSEPDFSVEASAVEKVAVTGGDGDDKLVLDHDNGLVSFIDGITFDEAGPGTNVRQDVNLTAIPGSLVGRIRSGLASFVEWSNRLAELSAAAQELPGLGASLADALAIGDGSDPISGALNQGLLSHVNAYFDNDPTPTVEELVERIRGASAVLGNLGLNFDTGGISGGLFTNDSGNQELRFDVALTLEGGLETSLELAAQLATLGLTFDAQVPLSVHAQMDLAFSFGLDLTPGLTDAQAFFVRLDEASVEAHVRAGAKIIKAPKATSVHEFSGESINLDLKLGFLQAQVIDGSLTLDARLDLSLNNPDDDAAGNITLQEFQNTPAGDLIDVSLEGELDANLPLQVSLPGLPLTVQPVITIKSDDLFGQVPDVQIENLGDLANFKDLSFQNILDMLQAALGYLQDLEQFDFLDEKLPLIDRSVGDALDTADSFSQKLEELRNNPATSLQAVEAQIEQFFGITDPNLVELTADGGQTLKIKLNLGTDFDEELPLDFQLTDLPGLPEELASIISLTGSGSLHVTGGASLGLAIGLDLSDLAQPAAFLYGDETTTSLFAKVETDTPIDFTFSIFGLGAAINDATFELHKMGDDTKAAAFTVALEDGGDGRIYFSELTTLSTSDVLVSLDGAAHLNMPFEFPPGTPIDDPLDVTVPDLAALLTGGTDPVIVNSYPDFDAVLANLDLSGDLGSLLNGLSQLLSLLQAGMNNGAFARKVPLIGDKLDEAANVIERFRTDLLAELQAFIDDPADKALPEVRRRLFDALGPSGLEVLVDGPDVGTEVNATDVGLFLDSLTNPQEFRFDLNLERTASESFDFDFDLGLPALGLSVDGDVAVEAGFKLKTGFGFLKGTGAYLRVQEPNELEVDVNVTVPGLAARGRLGFLQLDVIDDNSYFDANFGFDLISSDGRLTIAELTNSTFNARLDAGAKADVNLKLAVSYEDQANFPRVFADLNLDWAFGNADTGGSGNFGAAPQVAFNNVKLDLGSFLSRFARPVLDSVNKALGPVQPVVDFLNKELPLLWKVESVRNYFNVNGDKKITVSEVIQKLDPNAVLSFVDGVVALRELLEAANNTAVGANTLINLGSFNLNNVDLRNVNNLGSVPLVNYSEADTKSQLDGSAGEFSTALTEGRLGSSSGAGGGKLSFPILQSPRELFNLFMGKDPDMFLWDMPKFSADLQIDEDFPVFGPISIGFGGRVGIEADLTFGYDTSGLRKLASGNGTLGDVFDGFFVLDRPNGATDDPAEIRAFGEIFIKAEVDAVLVSGEVKGSLLGTLDLNLHDPDNTDGTNKIRIDDLNTQLNKGLLCVFDIAGELSAVLSGRIKVGVGPLSKTFSAEFAKIHLLDFTHTCEDDPPPVPQDPVLAANVGGELRLNMGPRAALRLHGGDLTDNDESFYVTSDADGTVFVTAYGYTQAFTGVVRIRGEGGLGNDTIEIAEGVNVPAVLYGDFASSARAGEFGNDQLTGGEIAATLWGGGGNDFLRGRSGRDELSGQDGNDALYGGDGRDSLEGGQGQDTLAGEAGDDQLFGGADNDLLEGGDGADILGGEAGDDLIVGDDESEGDSGGPTNDSLFGGAGNDELQGVYGNDSLVGGAGNDLIAGEAGNDTAQGNDGNDQVYGDAGNDQLQGNVGDDALAGGAGGDTVTGDDGHDVIFGDNAGFAYDLDADKATLDLAEPLDATGAADSLSGGNGDDVIVGQAGGDTVGGGAGNDVAIGDGATLRRAGATVLANDLRRRFALSDGGALYNADGTLRAAAPAAGATFADPQGVPHWAVTLSDHATTTPDDGSYGADTMTGEAGNDVMFGHLGNDTIDAGAGDDYVEGNGGADSVRGGLGQDVLVGGSGGRFGLDSTAKRPDGADRIVGGDGTRTGQGAAGDTTADGHALDSDFILGDNADAYLVVLDLATGAFARFNYDNYGTFKIIPRVAQRLDGTAGIGDGDQLHGEDGDDSIWGQAGGDALFGGGNDDDLIGGSGHDWLSGGAGDDGVLGDDGYLKTSRNGTAEPLYGIAASAPESIRTPGGIQTATINVNGRLKKSADLEPFDLGGDDIAYGGLGNDSLHGGAGDDALSGAEAAATLYSRALLFADQPINPGNVLGYGLNKQGEFADYDEYQPREKIDGHLLNFDPAAADGDDAIFGDTGNDWAVGGAGADNVYGGMGDDLLHLDDNLDTNSGLNDSSDGGALAPADRAFGGGGRDVLIANSENDRLIDWVGEFNSYIVPFTQFGPRTISRTLQPQLPEFLLKLAAGDGLDTTRADPNDPARLGEPDGELGIVRPQDPAWRDQTGAPDDPQPGNIPGGKRDTLDAVNFDTATSASRFAPDSGAWSVQSGGYLADYGGDTISLMFLDRELPAYFELQGTARINKAKAGQKANAFLIFDYRSATDFKFAGINDANDQVVIGQRTAAGWQVLKWGNLRLSPDTTYLLKLAVNGATASLLVNNQVQITCAFDRRLDDGMIGLGVDNSRTRFDNVEVLTLPPVTAWSLREDFNAGDNGGFATVLGSAGVSGGMLRTDAGSGGAAIAIRQVGASANSFLEFSAGVQVSTGGFGGLVFDYYSPTDFKYAAYDAASRRLVIGHRTARGWFTDASHDLGALSLGRLGVSIRGTAVSVLMNDVPLFGHVYNSALADGGVGVFANAGTALFDDLFARGDDSSVIL